MGQLPPTAGSAIRGGGKMAEQVDRRPRGVCHGPRGPEGPLAGVERFDGSRLLVEQGKHVHICIARGIFACLFESASKERDLPTLNDTLEPDARVATVPQMPRD